MNRQGSPLVNIMEMVVIVLGAQEREASPRAEPPGASLAPETRQA